MLKNKSLKKIKVEYLSQLEIIDNYLERIKEEKEQILINNGYEYFDHLRSENWDWE